MNLRHLVMDFYLLGGVIKYDTLIVCRVVKFPEGLNGDSCTRFVPSWLIVGAVNSFTLKGHSAKILLSAMWDSRLRFEPILGCTQT